MDRQSIMELCKRAQRACDDLAALQQTLNATRQETAALLAKAGHVLPLDQCPARTHLPTQPGHTYGEITEAKTDSEILHIMRALLDGLPVDRQITIMKALTTRTMHVIATQLGASPIYIECLA